MSLILATYSVLGQVNSDQYESGPWFIQSGPWFTLNLSEPGDTFSHKVAPGPVPLIFTLAVKGSLFFVTTGGKPLNTNELCQRLKSILQQLSSHHDDNTDNERSSIASTSNLEINRSQLKEKLLAKLKPNVTSIKCKNPFPENVVNKKIQQTCLTPCGKHLKVYTGKVLRMSTDKDIEELLEEEYKSYIDKDYTFYTIIYDPPYDQLYVFPLRKEWDDGLLEIV